VGEGAAGARVARSGRVSLGVSRAASSAASPASACGAAAGDTSRAGGGTRLAMTPPSLLVMSESKSFSASSGLGPWSRSTFATTGAETTLTGTGTGTGGCGVGSTGWG
jgi:hypothetical protein